MDLRSEASALADDAARRNETLRQLEGKLAVMTRASDTSGDLARASHLTESRDAARAKLEEQEICNAELLCERKFFEQAAERLRKARDAASVAVDAMTADVNRLGEQVAAGEVGGAVQAESSCDP
jgi:hypothetical protein